MKLAHRSRCWACAATRRARSRASSTAMPARRSRRRDDPRAALQVFVEHGLLARRDQPAGRSTPAGRGAGARRQDRRRRQRARSAIRDIEALRDRRRGSGGGRARENAGLSFVKLDGDVGCVVNGAGLAMATMDLVKYYGGEPANFLDIGGSSNPEKVVTALKIITARRERAARSSSTSSAASRAATTSRDGIVTALDQTTLEGADRDPPHRHQRGARRARSSRSTGSPALTTWTKAVQTVDRARRREATR